MTSEAIKHQLIITCGRKATFKEEEEERVSTFKQQLHTFFSFFFLSAFLCRLQVLHRSPLLNRRLLHVCLLVGPRASGGIPTRGTADAEMNLLSGPESSKVPAF